MWLLAAPPLLATLACIDPDMAQQAIDAVQMEVGRPEEFPQIRNEADAFRYPPELFGQRVQGNVTLRVYVDSTGLAVPDSTHVVESSGHAALDSAAVIGTLRVTFEPAKLRGRPSGMSILLPVYFRHPEAPPLPGDTVLNRRP
jgi:TonB family protein